MTATKKATTWTGEEIKGTVYSQACDTELLQAAFDHLSDANRFQYTTTFYVFSRYRDGVSVLALTTKKQAVETARNHEKGEALIAFVTKSFSTPKKLVGTFGHWNIISN